MKKQEIQAQTVEAIKGFAGMEQTDERYFAWDSPIGSARIRVDANCKSKVMSVCVNFKENTSIAKAVLGHWKQNLHLSDTEDFPALAKAHIDGIIERIADSDAWMFLECKEVFQKCPGLSGTLDIKEGVSVLSEKTGFSREWVAENIETLKKLDRQMGV